MNLNVGSRTIQTFEERLELKLTGITTVGAHDTLKAGLAERQFSSPGIYPLVAGFGQERLPRPHGRKPLHRFVMMSIRLIPPIARTSSSAA